jgi:hypothetical protein
MRNAGFILVHDARGYKLDLNDGTGKSISDLLHFSREEAIILSKAIHSIDDNHVMKTNLINKLYSLYDFERVPHSIF